MSRRLLSLLLSLVLVVGMMAVPAGAADPAPTEITVVFEPGTQGKFPSPPTDQREITFSLASGSYYSGFPKPISKDDDYYFIGWYTSATGGTEVEEGQTVKANINALYARWETKFSVTFNSNGGTPVAQKKYERNATYGNLPTPTQSGFTFGGWYTESTFTNKVTSSSIVDSNKTLYAKWDALKYTVTLDAHGGTGLNTTSFTIAKGEKYKVIGQDVFSQTITRTGYTFDAWYTEPNGKGTKIEDNSTHDTASTQTLHANWIPISVKMTLNYNYPSGVSGAPTPSPIPVTYDQSYDKTLPTPTPLTGTDYKYTFAGWYEGAEDKPVSTTDPNGVTYKEIKASDTIKSEKDFIIHARWTYEVTLDPDGGTVTPEKATLTTGTAVGGLPTPKKDGYEFEGWFTDSNCTEVNKVTDESIANSANKTFYAKWEAKTYTVTLDPNGGELTDDKKTVTVTYGVAYPNLKSDNVPTYIGYEFTGWFTEKDGGTEVTNSTKVTETGNHILYAHWKPRTYDVTLNYNVPTLDPEYNPVVKKLSGIDIDAKLQGLPSKSQVPGYEYKDTKFTFYNWYTKDGAMVNSQTPLTPDMLNDKKDGVNLNARWEYGIKFYYNTGTSSSASRPNETVNFITDTPYGNKLPTPTNTGKTLLGWFTAADNTGKQVSASDTAKGDITELYAHWTTSEYVVTLDDNGGKFRDDQKIRSHPYQYGDTYGDFVTNTDYIPDPPAGHTFIGWYTEKEGGTMLTSSTRFTESCTIFAHWKADQFKVTLDLGYDSNTTVHTVDYDTELSKVLPSPEPDRTGYAFEGWFEDKAFTKPADTKLKIQADITLYAKWKEAKRVSLDVGGGKLPENTPAYINVYEGGTYAKLPTPTWPGSIFKGWWTQKTGGKQVKPSDTVPAPSSIPVTLYARWESKKITVYLDYNGAPGEAGRTITCSVGDTYKSLPTYLSWAGHEFMGWYTKETGGEKVEKTTIVSVPSDDVEELTLFAHWGYTVVFEPGDGSGTMDKVAAEMDQPYTLPECTFTAPDGMRFGGWAIGSPDAPTQPAGSQYTVVRNLALYATWTDKPITITVTCTSGGSLATDDGKTNTVTAERGTDVTFIARPNAGYELKDLQVDGVSYNYTVEYTFRRIEEDHKIHAVFGRIDAPSYSSCDHGTNCPLSGYRDLNSNAWYHDAVHFCMDNVIMGGSNNSFKPNAKATRAEVATSLWSAEGREPVSGNGPLSKTYPDVAVSDWYYQPIEWATRRGILAGYSNGRFGPNDFITREQLVSVLWRHAGSPKPRNTVLRFNDASKVSGFAWDAMLWATERGIISGRPGGYLAPKGNATRADVAQVLKNYLN
ncbi:MAG: hypothetical protein HFE91_08615 [Acutalibacter sp.]|nr:hypothetical protein [Acutalibacter sp.]